MEVILSCFLILLSIFLCILFFTKERKTYVCNVAILTLCGLFFSMIAFPLYGPVFGCTSILLNSIVMGAFVDLRKFK